MVRGVWISTTHNPGRNAESLIRRFRENLLQERQAVTRVGESEMIEIVSVHACCLRCPPPPGVFLPFVNQVMLARQDMAF